MRARFWGAIEWLCEKAAIALFDASDFARGRKYQARKARRA